MSDTPDSQAPTEEDVAKWTAAIHEIMERDGVTEEEANIGLIAVLLSPPVQAQIRELEQQQATEHDHDVELWTSVIRDLQSRFPEWTEQECNDNLIALLKWAEENPAEA